MQQESGRPPKMWGSSIIGFGQYHYVYSNKKEADWLALGFSPRVANLTVYIMSGFGDHLDTSDEYGVLMKKLGKYKTGKSCLYIKKLADIDETVLRALIQKSLTYLKQKYQTNL